MKNFFKRLLAALKSPRGIVLAFLYPVTIAAIIGSIVLCVTEMPPMPYAVFVYLVFAVAALTLAYSVYTIVIFAPRLKKKIRTWAEQFDFLEKMLNKYGFRTIVFSVVSLGMSLLYVLFNGVIAVWERSIWYGALAAYYLFLVVLRGSVIFYHGKHKRKEGADEKREIKIYGTCGGILIFLPVCLSAAIAQMVSADKGFVHAGLTIYVSAAYTFYKITMSIVNSVRARKQEDLTVQAVRNVNLADAMVSVLALQTAMFHSFGGGMNTGFANALTGMGVCLMTVVIGIVMLVKTWKKKREVLIDERGE